MGHLLERLCSSALYAISRRMLVLEYSVVNVPQESLVYVTAKVEY